MEQSNEERVRHICIYHDDCTDGLVAALVFSLADAKIELIPAKYGEEPPYDRLKGAAVTIVDFSYSPTQMLRIAEVARLLTVLDHHVSAMMSTKAALEGADSGWMCAEVLGPDLCLSQFIAHRGNALIVFDMEESGASLAWKFMMAGSDPADMPRLITLVRDRDLWKFEHADTEPLYYGLQSFEQTIENLTPYMDNDRLDELLVIGKGVQAYFKARVGEVLKQQDGHFTTIGAYHVPVANVPHFMASVVAGELAKMVPMMFAATYYNTRTHRVYSLRSTSNGMDVSEVAKIYGGGGHRHAAGFKVVWNNAPI